METTSHIIEYRKLIEELAEKRANRRVPNGHPEHASILLETMFKRAEHDVRIYTGALNETVYGRPGLIEALKRFIARPGARLRVLLQDQHDAAWVKSQPMIKALYEKNRRDNVEVAVATGVYATNKAKHFSVMDDCGFRFEHDHSQTQAVANFNEPEIALELASVFDIVFGQAKPIQLTE